MAVCKTPGKDKTMEWKIRKAVKEDENRIRELFLEMLQTICHNQDVRGYEAGYLDKFFEGGEDWICVAEEDNAVIAYLSIEMHRERETYVYLDDLSVSEKYRGNGIGTELIQTAEKFAEENAVSTIVFHVEKSNAAASRLYKRLGYSVLNEEGSQYRMIKEKMPMRVIDYFSCDRPEYWLDQIKKSDWGAGQYLYSLLRENKLKDAVGDDTKVLLLTDGDELVSFCTYAEKDDIQPTTLTPWMGFVYTFPAYRGHRYVGKLFREIERLAGEKNVRDVYISTNHTGLYEKYGCDFYQMMNDMDGEPSRVYKKHFA